MSRSVPWRNKPTNLITQMIPVASEMKLYLLNQIGPTSFLFKDQHDNKFKVNIGSTVTCSCGVVQNDHCIHTLFVMLKKYRVSQSNSILWQASYLDSELQGLIQFKYQQIKKSSVPTAKYVSKRKANNNLEKDQDDFPPLGEDVTCPICFQDMEDQCYSTCGTCHKSIHSQCFKVWMRQKQYDGVSVTCPMCRAQFQNPSVMVMKDLERWSKRFTTHKGSNCKGCGAKNIQGLIYKCLMCPSAQLCKLCFDSFEHYEHIYYFVKQLSSEAWRVAPIRIKKKKFKMQYRSQVNIRQLPSDIESTQFMMSLFPTLRDQSISKGVGTLNIVGNELLGKQLCHKCHTPGDQSMKKINCGHTIHSTCLEFMIQSKQYLCEIDGEAICPGYLTAMCIKIPKKPTRTVDCAFIRTNQQAQKIKKKLGGGGLISSNQIRQPKTEETKSFSIGRKVDRFNEKQKNMRENTQNKFNAKSKDRNFRIMKKSILDKKQDMHLGVGMGFGSPMMVTGLNHNNQPLLPKPPSNQLIRGTRRM